jgi:hypothetical protein
MMKNVMTNLFKAGLTMIVGWTFAGWLLFLMLMSLTLISQS